MDVKKLKHSIIRVDHAGEYAAQYIYKGQICALKNDLNLKTSLNKMLASEKEHLDFFASKIQSEKTRPSVFLPLWKILGFGLGYSTGILGEKYAMACTVAVEEVIEKHYEQQIILMQNYNICDKNLKNNIKRIRQEEIDHKETGIEHNAKEALFYKTLSCIIKFGCKIGISLSKRF